MNLRCHIVLFFLLVAGLCAGTYPAVAQSPQNGAALLSAGAKSLDAKKYSNAVRQLTQAMRADGLSTAQIAKALLMRGVAQQGAGKPAQAIADLNSALWLQGLSNKDLAQAYANRGQAYQSVGMSDRATADLRKAREIDPNSKAIVAARSGEPASPVGNFQTRVETASRSPATAQVPGFRTEVSRDKPTARKPVPGFQTEVRTAAREPRPVPSFRTSILPDEPPKKAKKPAAPRTPPVSQKWSTSVASDQEKAEEEKSGGFFSGLWKSATGKDDDEAPAATDKKQAQTPAAADWGQATTVVNNRRPAPAAAPAPRPVSTPPSGRNYRVQLAAVRSQAEADATWKRLSARHAQLLAGRSPVIEKTEVGNLGTFYRIQIGPSQRKKQRPSFATASRRAASTVFLWRDSPFAP